VATTFSITFDEISSLVTGKHKKNTCKYADNKERYLEESNYRKAMLLHIIQQTSTGMWTLGLYDNTQMLNRGTQTLTELFHEPMCI